MCVCASQSAKEMNDRDLLRQRGEVYNHLATGHRAIKRGRRAAAFRRNQSKAEGGELWTGPGGDQFGTVIVSSGL